MATGKRRWVPIAAGIAVLLAFVGIGVIVVSVMWFNENATFERNVGRPRAEEAFAAAARRFPDPRPAIEIGDDRRPRPAPGAATRKNPGQITTLHVLAWDPKEGALADITVPMWLVRLKSGPIELGGYVDGLDNRAVRITAEDIERLGPGVVVDHELASGGRVLLSAH